MIIYRFRSYKNEKSITTYVFKFPKIIRNTSAKLIFKPLESNTNISWKRKLRDPLTVKVSPSSSETNSCPFSYCSHHKPLIPIEWLQFSSSLIFCLNQKRYFESRKKVHWEVNLCRNSSEMNGSYTWTNTFKCVFCCAVPIDFRGTGVGELHVSGLCHII